ncbi:hypothetical protein E2562_000025 [Oryza meyeriana var. granulata]|uniref:Peptidase A1 domain-containing protein n=1 Tax=Oryza meyeriana var. granulata TaxID=110450 RepID=A0A6G1DA79_9ORYZ|nr:hypothetical protein E2562_000025 [Oryza meyeriana var. granulata]
MQSIIFTHSQHVYNKCKQESPGAYTNGIPKTEYLVHLDIGTPPQRVQLMLDTGSDLAWT